MANAFVLVTERSDMRLPDWVVYDGPDLDAALACRWVYVARHATPTAVGVVYATGPVEPLRVLHADGTTDGTPLPYVSIVPEWVHHPRHPGVVYVSADRHGDRIVRRVRGNGGWTPNTVAANLAAVLRVTTPGGCPTCHGNPDLEPGGSWLMDVLTTCRDCLGRGFLPDGYAPDGWEIPDTPGLHLIDIGEP